jgi:adenylate kinase family enzyme
MKKMIFILADGLSLQMMNLPELINTAFLRETQLSDFYPELFEYHKIWKEFSYRSFINPSINRNCSIESANIALMMSTGMTESLYRSSNTIEDLKTCLFKKLRGEGVKVAGITNCPVADSTLGMFLCPETVSLYQRKIHSIQDFCNDMETEIVSRILDAEWDIIAGGGRRAFLPKEKMDPVIGEPGIRIDSRNILNEAREKGILVFDEMNFDMNKNLKLTDKRILFTLHHNYFRYQVERLPFQPIEPRLSELVLDITAILDTAECPWFCFVESGRIDHAAHNNSLYHLLGEILELYKLIGKIKTKYEDSCEIVLTSDHGCGGFSAVDTYELPYDGFSDGFSWGCGPGKLRCDSSEYWKNGRKITVNGFTPEFNKKNLKTQVSGVHKKVSPHDRTIVPLLVKNASIKNIGKYESPLDMFDLVSDYFCSENLTSYGNIVIISGAPGSGKTTICKELISIYKVVYISGDDYLNAVAENAYDDDTLDIAVSNMLFDAILLLKKGYNVVIDFVFYRKSEFVLLNKMSTRFKFIYVLLNFDVKTIVERDHLRPIAEQMTERCKVVVENINETIEYFSKIPLFLHIRNASLSAKEVAKMVLDKITEQE